MYKVVLGSTGTVFSELNPNLSFQSRKDLSYIEARGLKQNSYWIGFTRPRSSIFDFTICMVFQLWLNRILHFSTRNYSPQQGKFIISYNKNDKKLAMKLGANTAEITLPNSLNGKFVVFWLTSSFNENVIKLAISNLSAKLTINQAFHTPHNTFYFELEHGITKKIMHSSNFYDFDSEQYKRIMLQEKLNGSYVE